MNEFVIFEGGITAPEGFKAGGIHCGIKRKSLDLAIVYTVKRAFAAAVVTSNLVKAAPIGLCKSHLKNPVIQAIVVNSGNANCCTGKEGEVWARKMAFRTAEEMGVEMENVLVCSTGTIGKPLPIELIEDGIKALKGKISEKGGHDAAEAILTTDLRTKEIAVRFSTSDGRTVTIGGMAKGSGMIDPSMATMLAFLSTDAVCSPAYIEECLKEAVAESFNCITVDGDKSTNDMVVLLANGDDQSHRIEPGSEDDKLFRKGLNFVCEDLARKIAADGEGASKLVEIHVTGAANIDDAKKAAHSVANSNLLKVALHGCSPNWGRIMAALGASGVSQLYPEKIDIFMNGMMVAKNGQAGPANEDEARNKLDVKEIRIDIDLKIGEGYSRFYTCDLTKGYIDINL
ncbi:MAG: bifunctional glutamate N-acetyltransferase/amino-acid acetyltransferase ArgJ [Candidatus Theseobacter exili]|nr:bifunctional glutamate N-acetyltransferase/amino-acid acetyltransferase ArgJ [Candidatus Theseobacter exili]